MTSRNQGLSSNDQGRQRRETLGTRLYVCMYVCMYDNHVICRPEFSSNTNEPVTVFQFLQRSVDGKRLLRLQSEKDVSNSSSVVWTGH